jgi:molybdopterin-binding protein
MDLLTPRHAAARLGVSYATIKHWIYKGTIRTRPTAGGHHRIPQSEVDRLVAAAGGPAPSGHKPAAPGTLVSISGRNQLPGIVEEVRSEGLLAQVRVRIGDQVLTAIITRDAVDELKLRRGDEAVAIIKSTEVMIARPSGRPSSGRRSTS